MRHDDAGGGRRGRRPELTPRLLSHVKQSFGLTVSTFEDVGGSISLNVRLRGMSPELILRVHRTSVSPQRLGSVHRVKEAVRQSGLPCPTNREATDGSLWHSFEGQLYEVEEYMEHDQKMDSWSRLEKGLPVLGRLHTILAGLELPDRERSPAWANYLSAGDMRVKTERGTARIRSWGAHGEIADLSEWLSKRVETGEGGVRGLPPSQQVHGDFWDTNVLFQGGKLAAVLDFDFSGFRPRIDDLALTLYFISIKHRDCSELPRKIAQLVKAYEQGLDVRLSDSEREALLWSIARQPLWSIGVWVADLDDEETASRHAQSMLTELRWAKDFVSDIDGWRQALIEA